MVSQYSSITTPSAVPPAIADSYTRLKRLHMGRIEELKTDRLLRDLDETASMLAGSIANQLKTKIISSHPQNYWDWAVASLSNLPFKYRVPPAIVGGDDKASKLERLCYGFDWQINSRRRKGTWEHELANQVVSGSYSFFPDLRLMPDGSYLATLEFWDPATVMWEEDSIYGTTLVVRQYRSTKQQALAEAKRLKGTLALADYKDDQQVTCFDVRELDEEMKVWHTLYVESETMLPKVEQIHWDAIPINCGTVNGRGNEQWDNDTSELTRTSRNMGRSILAPIRQSIRNSNEWRSLTREHARRSIFLHFLQNLENPDDPAVTQKDLKKIDESLNIKLGINEKAGYMQMPTTPFDVQAEIERDRADIEQGSVAPGALGSNNPQFSSSLLYAQLENAQSLRQGPYARVYNAAAETMMKQIIGKFKRMGGEIKGLEGRDLRKRGMEAEFQEDFSAEKDIPKYWTIKVWHDPAKAMDKNAIILNQAQLYKDGAISLKTYQEEVGIEDTDAEDRQKALEELRATPLVKQSRMLNGYYEEIQRLYAEAAAEQDERKKQILLLEARAAEGQLAQAERALDAAIAGDMQQSLQGLAGQQAPQPNATGPGTPQNIRPYQAANTAMISAPAAGGKP